MIEWNWNTKNAAQAHALRFEASGRATKNRKKNTMFTVRILSAEQFTVNDSIYEAERYNSEFYNHDIDPIGSTTLYWMGIYNTTDLMSTVMRIKCK